jgi:hypothetical protein
MKREYLIIFLFSLIMLLVPCTSAFEMPLSDDDKVELKSLINNENANTQDTLNEIMVYNESTHNLALDLDEVEKIYENYFLTGDDSVITSDSWDWLVKRLGWIYLTIEQVVTIYYSGIAIYYEILEVSEALQNFFNSIQVFRDAWQAFKAFPLFFSEIKNLITSTINLLIATITLLDYVTSNTIIQKIIDFADQVQAFRDFLNNDPWLQPILIKGNITGFDDNVTISVKSESITSPGYYELNYNTNDTIIPWFVHKCVITATYKDKTSSKNRYAFSMGIIEEDYVPSDFNSKSKQIEKPVFMKLSLFLKQSLKERFNIFDDIIKMWIKTLL